MMTPFEAETGSQEVLLQKKGWWARRTALEKILLSVLGVAGMAMMVTGVMVANPGGDNAENRGVRGNIGQEDVCLTPECAVAGKDTIFVKEWERPTHVSALLLAGGI